MAVAEVIYALWLFMMLAIFLVQLQLIFKLFLLNRVLRACVLGKCFLIKRRNVPPTFVCTLSLYGGLNQIMLLALFLVLALWFVSPVNSRISP